MADQDATAAARLMDVAGETNENFNPIFGVLATPLLTLLAAVAAATGGSAALAGVDLGGAVICAQRSAKKKLKKEGADPHGLELEEVAAL